MGVLDRGDQWHSEAHRIFANLADFELLTCEPAITEACFLLSSSVEARTMRLDLVNETVAIGFDLEDELITVNALVKKYKDVPMSLADACLVRMSEL